GSSVSSTQGAYSVLEQSLWHHPLTGHDGERAVSGFVQLGIGDSHVNAMTTHVGGGTVLQAPFATRPQDSIGVGATWVRLSDLATLDSKSEIIFEGYYKFVFSKHISLTQDFQYLHRPGGASSSEDSLAASSRLLCAF